MNLNISLEKGKKYLPIVLTIFIVVLVFIFLISSCKPEGKLGAATETSNYPKWEYMTVSVRCDIDRQKSELVCYDVKTSDASIINNLLQEKGNQGWELTNTISTNDNSVQTLIFKRSIE